MIAVVVVVLVIYVRTCYYKWCTCGKQVKMNVCGCVGGYTCTTHPIQ